MFRHYLKAGAALFLLSAGGPSTIAQSQAQDLAATAQAATQIVIVKTTPQHVAFNNKDQRVAFATNNQSGTRMSPTPDTGTLAMLITGICLLGVAASRRKVAA